MKHVVDENEIIRHIIPRLFTFMILLLMIGFIIISKIMVTHDHKMKEISVMSGEIYFTETEELNTSECRILSMLYASNYGKASHDDDHKMDSLYRETLNQYLCSSGVDLSPRAASQVEDRIRNLQELRMDEDDRDISKMSVDGRKIAIYLTERIYDLCGLTIEYSMEGVITSIADQFGNLMYSSDQQDRQDNIHIEALIITLVAIVTLLCICIMIAKRNQLFLKDMGYDEFDEERFA